MSESRSQTTLLFNTNLSGEIDDSELIDNYDKQYEKVKKRAKAELPPIDSKSDLNLNKEKSSETLVKKKPKKKTDTNQNYQTEEVNNFKDNQVCFPPTPSPPPPDSIKHLPNTEKEAYISMLMSYYMSGFHSGYYLGIKKTNFEN